MNIFRSFYESIEQFTYNDTLISEKNKIIFRDILNITRY